MKKRRLGTEGPELSVLGIGSWKAGGSWIYGIGKSDDGEAVQTLQRAFEGGVNWVDTAPIYGYGRAEEVVGRAVRGYDGVLVNTKCGHHLAPDGKSTCVDCSPPVIRQECEDSLKRLGRDHLDLYLFHLPDTRHPIEECWAEMLRLQREGKVRYVGACNFSTELLDRCQSVGPVQVVEYVYSLIHPEAEADLLPWCARNGAGFLGYEVQATGLLAGRYTRESLAALPPEDYRHRHADFQEPGFSRALQLVDQLRPWAADAGLSLSELVIAAALVEPRISGLMIGASNPQQVEGWLRAGDIDLPPELWQRIRRAAEAFGGAGDYSSVLKSISANPSG
ncbi:MAG: aldo/keto reductase [Armatimonadetes bacterium]|nr:aldo/keto reductase [Armatimonadota bacterium]